MVVAGGDDIGPGQTWVEVSVETNGEGAEAVGELFNHYGVGGAVAVITFDAEAACQEDGASPTALTVKTYIPAGEEGAEVRRRLEEGLWHLSQLYPLPSPSFRVLSCEDWAVAWKKHFPILHLGRQIVIRPPWLEYHPHPEEVVIELEPGMAFGTGLHPTTRMCLSALEELVRPGMRVLDIGTGSGILAITAAKLGAESVLALDIDSTAVRTAQANVAANEVADRVRVEQGSLKDVEPSTWQVIVVNILAETIVSLLKQGLASYLGPKGSLITGGIVEEQVGEVEEAFALQGLTVSGRRREGDWVTLIGQP